MRAIFGQWRLGSPVGYATAAVGVLAASVIVSLLLPVSGPVGPGLLYIPVVLAVAVIYGRGPGVVAALFAGLAFDFFFGNPAYTLIVNSPQEWISLITFVMVALVTGALSAEVRARAHEAAERELEASVLRRSDELKTALLHAVGHDLRTPLAAIKAAAGSLGNDALPPDERRGLGQMVEREVDRLNRMVGNLLDLSRIEAGALRPRKEVYPLAAVVDDVVARVAPAAPDHVVLVDVPEELPPVPLDYVQVDQVLTNLVENAFRHTPPGTEVRVSARREKDDVEVTVADSGPGVPPAALDRIFEKFYRAPDAAQRAGGGSGLGLAVVKGLVEAHGGRTWAEAVNGHGLAVHFTLPLDGAGGEEER